MIRPERVTIFRVYGLNQRTTREIQNARGMLTDTTMAARVSARKTKIITMVIKTACTRLVRIP